MSTWQPIETAPKDGTVVMLYSSEFDGRCHGVHLAHHGYNDWLPYVPVNWTHWMPLPDPPVAEGLAPSRGSAPS